MIKKTCSHCGSVEFALSDFRRKDFPGNLFFIECSRCHRQRGVVDLQSLIDSARSFDVDASRSARELLSRMPVDKQSVPSAQE